MVGSILPIVYGEHSTRRLSVAFIHAFGTLLGGTLLGAAILVPLSLVDPGAVGIVVAGVACAVLGAHEMLLVRLRLPSSPKQVPVNWKLWRRGSLTALAFGAGLGFAVTTRITTVLTYVMLLCAVFLVPSAAVLAGVAYGLGRGAPIVVLAMRSSSIELAQQRADRWMLAQALMKYIAGVVTAMLAGSIVGGLI